MGWLSPTKPHAALGTDADLAKPLPPETVKQLADGLLPPRRMAQAIDYAQRSAPPINPDPARFAVVKNWSGGYGLQAIPQANASAEHLARERATWGQRVQQHMSRSIASSVRAPVGADAAIRPIATISAPVPATYQGTGALDLDTLLRAKSNPCMTGYGRMA